MSGEREIRRGEARRTLQSLRRDAAVLAQKFELSLKSIEAERANVKRRYGVCFDDGCIRIRLRHLRTGELLKYSSLVDTLCHELAHLRHFDHGPRFEELYQRILAWARSRGIYRPAPRGRNPRVGKSGASLALRQSSILPLARLESARRATAKRPPADSASGSRISGRGFQLELFR